MKRVPDRIKLRREYLKRKRLACAACIAIGLLTGKALLMWVRSANLGNTWTSSAICVVIFIVCIVMIASGDVIKQTTDLRYVPPVMPNTLPADEILVRGAEEPLIAQSEVLLRVATTSEAPQDELLRVTDSPNHAGS